MRHCPQGPASTNPSRPLSSPPQGELSAEEVTQQSGIASLVPGSDIHDFLFEPCGYSCNALFEVRTQYWRRRPSCFGRSPVKRRRSAHTPPSPPPLLQDAYFTIHVTPQKEFSYASFETDVTMVRDRPSRGTRKESGGVRRALRTAGSRRHLRPLSPLQKDYGPLINRVLEIFKPRYFALNVFCNYSAECGRAENAFEDSDVKVWGRGEVVQSWVCRDNDAPKAMPF